MLFITPGLLWKMTIEFTVNYISKKVLGYTILGKGIILNDGGGVKPICGTE
jgi:hypothetical protein